MDQKFLKFIPKLLLFSSPFIALVLSYFICDPFNVLYKKELYGSNYLEFVNRNVISTSTYLRYNPQHHFNSFIFGSSRSSAFQTTDWQPYIGEGKPYHFDAFNENISGIRQKLNFIEKQGETVKNALVVIDLDSFSERFEEMESLPHLKDPRWLGLANWKNKAWWAFQLNYFKSYFKNYFFLEYFDAKIFKTYRPWFEGNFGRYDSFYYSSPSNDFTFPMHLEEMHQDSVKYYQNPKLFKSKRELKSYDSFIKDYHIDDIKAIAAFFQKQNTQYKIIIGPTYNWNFYNSKDLAILETYFGKENIFDYSGRNKFTENAGDYYDDSHYKPYIGKQILKEIYP